MSNYGRSQKKKNEKNKVRKMQMTGMRTKAARGEDREDDRVTVM